MLGAQVARKLKIGVFMGGRSIEREVSFNSGRTICDHLDTDAYEVIPLFQTEVGDLYILPWHFLHRGKIADFRQRLDAEAQSITWDMLKVMVDFIYIAVHGRFGEDGTLQGMLDVLGIPYLGTKVLGSALGMDKAMQKELFKAHGIDVAHGIVVQPYELSTLTSYEILDRLSKQGVSLPVIIKPVHEGSSLGISCVKSADELLEAVRKAANVDTHRSQAVIIEEKIIGSEFVCVLVEQRDFTKNATGDTLWKALPLTHVLPEGAYDIFDYEQKYMPGRATKVTPAPYTQEDTDAIVRVCKDVSQILSFATISRIDGFLTHDGRIVITDPNSLTGMAPSSFLFHQAAEIGMSHTRLINFLIEHELREYGLGGVVSAQREGAMDMHSMGDVKKRIVVLLGGDSNEREISLESGRNVCYKLSPQKYDVIPVFVNDAMELFRLDQRTLIKNSTREIGKALTEEMRLAWSDLPHIADFVFLGLHGGKGENGSIQGALEMLGLPYNGSGVLASALCMDKFRANNFLRMQGFDVPSSQLISSAEWFGLTEQQRLALVNDIQHISFPLIVKPHNDGCSVMVKKAQDPQQLCAILNEFFAAGRLCALLEELIVGTELTCGVLGNDVATALPPSQTVAREGILSLEEKFLPGAGENQTPALISPEATVLVQRTMEKAYTAVGCKGYARIDCFYQSALESPTGKERVVILEFNTLPALTPATCIFHQAAERGIKAMDFIDTIVQYGFQIHQNNLKKNSLTHLLGEGNVASRQAEG